MNKEREQIQFSFSHTVVQQGDGTFLVKVHPTLGREKLSVTQAVRRYGTSRATMLRLYHSGLIEGERPSPRKTLLFADAIEKHLKATRDPEFWEGKAGNARRKLYLRFNAQDDQSDQGH